MKSQIRSPKMILHTPTDTGSYLKRLLFLFLLVMLATPSVMLAQSAAVGATEQRGFDEDQLNELRKEHIYDREPPKDLGFLKALQHWFNKLLGRMFSTTSSVLSNFWNVLLILGIGAAVLVIILNLLQVNITALFSDAKTKPNVVYKEIAEDIRAIDLFKLLEEAIENKDHRSAIRYYYLIILKQLDERKLIKWQQDKTNAQYLRELKDGLVKDKFSKATYIFDNVWYGDVSLMEEKYRLLEITMRSLKNELANG